ncbi:MAG: hypothetical protein QHH74_03995 [Spirochaetota bacterium]|nr:hypothetical protein [Spirochaetota bacterium]
MIKTFIHLSQRIASVILMAIAIIYFSSCSNDNFNSIINQENAYTNTSPDSTAPKPGNNGLLIVTNITENSAKIQWTLATDNSPPELLQYQVIVSRTLTLFSLEEILQSGLLDEDKWSNELVTEQIITNLLFGKQYFVNVCVRDPDNNISIYTPAPFTTIGRIYLFSAGTYTGAMASSSSTARQDINNLIHQSLINNPTLPQDHYVAFISIDSVDAIINFPEHYGIPANWPIYSDTGLLIAYNWNDLLDGTIIGELQNLGVCDSFWWSGSLQDGSCDTDYTCNTWTSPITSSSSSTLAVIPVLTGRSGAHNRTNYEWIYSNDRNCNDKLHLLGLCW